MKLKDKPPHLYKAYKSYGTFYIFNPFNITIVIYKWKRRFWVWRNWGLDISENGSAFAIHTPICCFIFGWGE